MIDRRRTLAGLAAMFSVPLFAPIARAAGLEGKVSHPVLSDAPPRVAAFTPPQKACTTALSERVLPPAAPTGDVTVIARRARRSRVRTTGEDFVVGIISSKQQNNSN